MITLHGKWFDGRTSEQTDAVLKVYDNGAWRLERSRDGEMLRKHSKFTPTASARLANTPRYLNFADGESFETIDNEGVDAILAMLHKSHWSSGVHILESKLRYIIPALIICILLGAGAVKYGVPAASKLIAARLPEHIVRKAGEQTLAILDKIVFGPSTLEPVVERRLRNHIRSAVGEHADLKIQVAFRKGGAIGPNAFALPGGQVIFTDEMIELSENDDEILAVLVHEIGHVAHQHSMRRVVQDSLLSFAILSLTGDASGVSELFLGLPVVLTELAYSREFEREADRYAIDYMRSHDIPLHYFGDILLRISAMEKAKKADGDRKWTNYLSTHPPTRERVDAFADNPRKP